MITIPIFTLCDFAQSNGGKVTIVGTFNRIMSANFPFVYQQGFYIVAKISSTEPVECNFVLSIQNSKGENLIPKLTNTFKIPEGANKDREITSDLIIGIEKLAITEAGTYTITLDIDGIKATQNLYIDKIDV